MYVRIVITTLCVMLGSSVIAFILSNAYYQFKLKPSNDQKITVMADDIVTFYKNNPEVDLDNYLQSVAELGYQMYLVDEKGEGIFYGDAFRKRELDIDVIKSVMDGSVYHGIANFPSSTFITGFFANDLTNSIGIPIEVDQASYALFIRSDPEMQFGELRIFFALLIALTAILSVLLVVISTRYVVKPITQLTEATKEIVKGTYNIHLHVKRRDEIGILATNFSKMATHLEQLEDMRQEFVSSVSHEIQSPLASIKGFTQTLQNDQLTPEERKQYLRIIEEESQRLSQLSKQLLMLASLDKEHALLEKNNFRLDEQIKQVLVMTEWSWREKEIAVDLELSPIEYNGDRKLLYQVWENLITNAVKYSEAGSSLSIQLRTVENHCIVRFTDTGIGISEKDMPYIFNRFYKADKARSRQESRNSSGLGLAITKKIIDLHGGKIEVESQLGKGTTFTISLPLL